MKTNNVLSFCQNTRYAKGTYRYCCILPFILDFNEHFRKYEKVPTDVCFNTIL